ncbi:MAG TPA: PEP-CTERM sorting domain-containing protein [Verrucomicrobiae bacterium]|nr:PEP-CTERM sorting domain-containing protein [Verrucomicrobiae bacterium]
MRTKLLTSTSIAAGAMLCGAAQAQVINFNASLAGGETTYSGQGAYSDPGNDYWNALVQNGTTPLGLDSTGGFATAIANVTLTDTSPGSYNGGLGAGTPGTPSAFFAGFVLTGGGAVTTETLNNVPDGVYDLFLYGSNTGQDRGVTFNVNGVIQSTVNANVVGAEAAPTAFTEGVNYVEYDNLVVSGGTLSFTYTANQAINRTGQPSDNYGVNLEADFNGLQLVQVVPEPSTMAFVGIGLAGGLFRIIRRRRA